MLAVLALATPLVATLGLVIAVRGMLHEHRAASRSAEPGLTRSEREALGIASGDRLLWGPIAGGAVSAALAAQSGADPERVYQLDIYSNYAFLTGAASDDDAAAVHAEWRRGSVTSARVRLGESATTLPTFRLDEVPWGRVAGLMEEASGRLGIAEPEVRYLQIDGGLFGAGGLTLRVYLMGNTTSGPVSGVVEADATGAVLRVSSDA